MTVTIPAIPLWRALHRVICGPGYAGARLPIWRFLDTASGLALSVKPLPEFVPSEGQLKGGIRGRVLSFRCVVVAVEHSVATAAMLVAPSYDMPNRWWRRKFELVQYDARVPRWCYEVRDGQRAYFADPKGLLDLDRRIVEVLRGGVFDDLTPSMMLGSNCLLCGYPMSNPISRARFVGPCCWGGAPATVPLVIRLAELSHEKRERRR
jgi:hypothetical protein